MLNTMYTSFIRAMSNIYMPPDEAEFFRDVGIKIARLRKELGLTQTELGQKIGVQQQVIASYEIGRRRISAFTLTRLAEALFIEVEQLLPAEDKPKKRGPAPKLQQDIHRLYQLPQSKQHLVSQLIETLIGPEEETEG